MFVLNNKKENPKNNLAKKVAILKNLQKINKNSQDSIKLQNNIPYQTNDKKNLNPDTILNLELDKGLEEELNDEVGDLYEVGDLDEEGDLYEVGDLDEVEDLDDEVDTDLDDELEGQNYLKEEELNSVKLMENTNINTINSNQLIIYNSIYNFKNNFKNNYEDNFKNNFKNNLKNNYEDNEYNKNEITLYTVNNDIKNFIKNDIDCYINNNNLKLIEEENNDNIDKDILNYQEKMNTIQELINKIINNTEKQNPYIYRKLILDEKKNIPPRKKLFNKDKINKIITEDTIEARISAENVYNKFNHIVNKINDKVQKEIINNKNNYFDILKDKKSQENIFNMICFSILSKIENIVNL